MLSLLVWLLIMALVFALIYWVLTLLPLPPNIRQIIIAILAVIFIIILLSALLGGVPFPGARNWGV